MQTTAVAVLAAGAWVAAPTSAAPPSGPRGSIAVASTEDAAATADGSPGLQYDGTVAFATTVEGKISSQARIYVTVVCWQDANVVYQWSAAPDFQFPLTDQAGQGLEWNGGDAFCEAWLIYRVEKGKAAEITVLATTSFNVAGTTA